MPDLEHVVDTPQPVHLYVEVPAGSVRVHLTDTTTSRVELSGRDAEQVSVTLEGDDLAVVAPKHASRLLGRQHEVDVVVTVPEASDVAGRTGSGDITVTGEAGRVALRSGSGDVLVEVVGGEGRVETGSGAVRVGQVRDELAVKCGSGDVVLDLVEAATVVSTGSGDVVVARAAATVAVKTGSGDIRVVDALDDVRTTTGSGDLELVTVHRGRVGAKTASGDVRVGVVAGVPVFTDIQTVSGRISSGLQGGGRPTEGQDHVELRATTVSGDVVLTER
ncbi:DUF4097 family beta strand repeat-containing protein [Nocardioides nanhaiensis]|uniref:DUF4097 family beta strand repeat-containing protein n=1 Tax=Nocardioides nanhaiensis TaxID=1476871 RepID=A0ABP8VRI3_9ACTN